MKKEHLHKEIDSIAKNLLSDFEVPVDSTAWSEFSKQLNKEETIDKAAGDKMNNFVVPVPENAFDLFAQENLSPEAVEIDQVVKQKLEDFNHSALAPDWTNFAAQLEDTPKTFDEGIRGKILNFIPTNIQNEWQRLQADLPAEEKKKRFAFIWWTTAIAGILLGGILYSTEFNSDSSSPQLALNQTDQETVTETKKHNKKQSKYNSTSNATVEKSATTKQPTTEQTTTLNTTINNTANPSAKTIIKNKQQNTGKNSSKKGLLPPVNNSSANQSSAAAPTQQVLAPVDATEDNVIEATGLSTELGKQIKGMTPEANTLQNKRRLLDATPLAVINEVNQTVPVLPFVNSVQSLQLKKAYRDHIYIGLQAGMDANLKTNLGNKNVGTSFGIFVEIEWSPKISVQTGLNNSYKTYDKNIVFQKSNSYNTVNALKISTLNILELPVLCNYELIQRKSTWKVDLSGGLSANAILNRTYSGYQSIEGPNDFFVKSNIGKHDFEAGLVKGGSFSANVYPAVHVGLGVRRELSRRHFLFIKSTYKQALSKSGDQADFINSFALTCGIKLKIR